MIEVWEVRTFFHDGSGFVSHHFHTTPQPWPCEQTAQEVAQAWRCLWPDELAGLPLRVAVRPSGEACAPVVVELPEVAAPFHGWPGPLSHDVQGALSHDWPEV